MLTHATFHCLEDKISNLGSSSAFVILDFADHLVGGLEGGK